MEEEKKMQISQKQSMLKKEKNRKGKSFKAIYTNIKKNWFWTFFRIDNRIFSENLWLNRWTHMEFMWEKKFYS